MREHVKDAGEKDGASEGSRDPAAVAPLKGRRSVVPPQRDRDAAGAGRLGSALEESAEIH
jgi:hypothetical protein